MRKPKSILNLCSRNCLVIPSLHSVFHFSTSFSPQTQFSGDVLFPLRQPDLGEQGHNIFSLFLSFWKKRRTNSYLWFLDPYFYWLMSIFLKLDLHLWSSEVCMWGGLQVDRVPRLPFLLLQKPPWQGRQFPEKSDGNALLFPQLVHFTSLQGLLALCQALLWAPRIRQCLLSQILTSEPYPPSLSSACNPKSHLLPGNCVSPVLETEDP